MNTALIGYTAALVVLVCFYRIERKLVGINEELAAINASLEEAGSEIVAKIAQLEAVAAAGEVADPALLAEVRVRAEGLANVVPNAFTVEGSEAPDPAPEG